MDLPQEPDDELVESKPKPGIHDAHEFVVSVRVAFGADSEEYAEFQQLLMDRMYRRDMELFRTRIEFLLEEHPHLIEGFNVFFPAGLEIPILNDNSVSKAVGFEEAVAYVNKVKEEYTDDDGRRYKSFVNILESCRIRKRSAKEVYEEVSALFHDRPDLIAEFRKFLPSF